MNIEGGSILSIKAKRKVSAHSPNRAVKQSNSGLNPLIVQDPYQQQDLTSHSKNGDIRPRTAPSVQFNSSNQNVDSIFVGKSIREDIVLNPKDNGRILYGSSKRVLPSTKSPHQDITSSCDKLPFLRITKVAQDCAKTNIGNSLFQNSSETHIIPTALISGSLLELEKESIGKILYQEGDRNFDINPHIDADKQENIDVDDTIPNETDENFIYIEHQDKIVDPILSQSQDQDISPSQSRIHEFYLDNINRSPATITTMTYSKLQKFIYDNLNDRDKSALKVGRLIMSNVLGHPDIRTADSISRFFLDNWLSQLGGSSATETDSLNIDLLCKFEKTKREIEMFEALESTTPTTTSNKYDIHDNISDRALCALACECLDRLIEECGDKNPILRQIRDSILPCIFVPSNEPLYLLEPESVTKKTDYSTKKLWCQDSMALLKELEATRLKLEESQNEMAVLRGELTALRSENNEMPRLKEALQEERQHTVNLRKEILNNELKITEQRSRIAELMFEFGIERNRTVKANKCQHELDEELKVLRPRLSAVERDLAEAQQLLISRSNSPSKMEFLSSSMPNFFRTGYLEKQLSFSGSPENPTTDGDTGAGHAQSNSEKKPLGNASGNMNGAGAEGPSAPHTMSLGVNLRLQLKEARAEISRLNGRLEEMHHQVSSAFVKLDAIKTAEEAGRLKLAENARVIESLKSDLLHVEADNTNPVHYIQFLSEFNEELCLEVKVLREAKLKYEQVIAELHSSIRQKTYEAHLIVVNEAGIHARRIEELQVAQGIAIQEKNSMINSLRLEADELQTQLNMLQTTFNVNETKLSALQTKYNYYEQSRKDIEYSYEEMYNQSGMIFEDTFKSDQNIFLRNALKKIYYLSMGLRGHVVDFGVHFPVMMQHSLLKKGGGGAAAMSSGSGLGEDLAMHTDIDSNIDTLVRRSMAAVREFDVICTQVDMSNPHFLDRLYEEEEARRGRMPVHVHDEDTHSIEEEEDEHNKHKKLKHTNRLRGTTNTTHSSSTKKKRLLPLTPIRRGSAIGSEASPSPNQSSKSSHVASETREKRRSLVHASTGLNRGNGEGTPDIMKILDHLMHTSPENTQMKEGLTRQIELLEASNMAHEDVLSRRTINNRIKQHVSSRGGSSLDDKIDLFKSPSQKSGKSSRRLKEAIHETRSHDEEKTDSKKSANVPAAGTSTKYHTNEIVIRLLIYKEEGVKKSDDLNSKIINLESPTIAIDYVTTNKNILADDLLQEMIPVNIMAEEEFESLIRKSKESGNIDELIRVLFTDSSVDSSHPFHRKPSSDQHQIHQHRFLKSKSSSGNMDRSQRSFKHLSRVVSFRTEGQEREKELDQKILDLSKQKTQLQNDLITSKLQLNEAHALVDRIRRQVLRTVMTGMDDNTEDEPSGALNIAEDIESTYWIFNKEEFQPKLVIESSYHIVNKDELRSKSGSPREINRIASTSSAASASLEQMQEFEEEFDDESLMKIYEMSRTSAGKHAADTQNITSPQLLQSPKALQSVTTNVAENPKAQPSAAARSISESPKAQPSATARSITESPKAQPSAAARSITESPKAPQSVTVSPYRSPAKDQTARLSPVTHSSTMNSYIQELDQKLVFDWKRLLYRSDGTVNRYMDFSMWNNETKLEIYEALLEAIRHEDEDFRKQQQKESIRAFDVIKEIKRDKQSKDREIFDLKQICLENNIPISTGEGTEIPDSEFPAQGYRGLRASDIDDMRAAISETTQNLYNLCYGSVAGLLKPMDDSILKLTTDHSQNSDISKRLFRPSELKGHIVTDGTSKVLDEGAVVHVKLSGVDSHNHSTNPLATSFPRKGPTEYFGNPAVLYLKMRKETQRQRALDAMYKPKEDSSENILPVRGERIRAGSARRDFPEKIHSKQQTVPPSNQLNEVINLKTESPSTVPPIQPSGSTRRGKLSALCEQMRLRTLFYLGVNPYIIDTTAGSITQNSINSTNHIPEGKLARIDQINDEIRNIFKKAHKLHESVYGILFPGDEEKLRAMAERYYANLATFDSKSKLDEVYINDGPEFVSRKYLEGSGSDFAYKLSWANAPPAPLTRFSLPENLEHVIDYQKGSLVDTEDSGESNEILRRLHFTDSVVSPNEADSGILAVAVEGVKPLVPPAIDTRDFSGNQNRVPFFKRIANPRQLNLLTSRTPSVRPRPKSGK